MIPWVNSYLTNVVLDLRHSGHFLLFVSEVGDKASLLLRQSHECNAVLLVVRDVNLLYFTFISNMP